MFLELNFLISHLSITVMAHSLLQRVMVDNHWDLRRGESCLKSTEYFANKRDYVLFIKQSNHLSNLRLGTCTHFPSESIFSTFVFLTVTTTLCFIALVHKAMAL